MSRLVIAASRYFRTAENCQKLYLGGGTYDNLVSRNVLCLCPPYYRWGLEGPKGGLGRFGLTVELPLTAARARAQICSTWSMRCSLA